MVQVPVLVPGTYSRMTESAGSSSKRLKQNDAAHNWHIFPSKQRTNYQVGQSVLLRGTNHWYKAGTIVQIESTSVDVYVKETSTHTRVSKKDQRRLLLPCLGDAMARNILVTSETAHFRQLVGYIMSDDRVLEIGCSSGETSKLIVPRCRSWVGFDTSQEMLQRCERMLLELQPTNQYHCVIVNALVDPQKARKAGYEFGNPNVVFMDIGGNRECINVVRMMSWILETYDPRLVVVKSRELVHSIHSSSCKIHEETGSIENGHEWFRWNRQKRAMPKHPKKAALVMSPIDPNKAICRYHNYHKIGCKKDDCDLDHDHCHSCLKSGHIAMDCPALGSKTNAE